MRPLGDFAALYLKKMKRQSTKIASISYDERYSFIL